MPGVKIEGQPGGAAGPGGPGGPVGASGSFGGYSTSQLLMAQDGGGAAALGPGAFMAAHAMRSMNVSASLGGNVGMFNPMAIGGVHGTGLLGLGLAGMGPGIGNVRPNLNVVSSTAGGTMMGGMTDALLRDIAVTGHEQVRIERRQLALEEAFGTGRGRMPGIWRSTHTAGGPADMPGPPGGWGGTAQVPRSWIGTNAPGDGEGSGSGGGGGGGRWSGGAAEGGRRGGGGGGHVPFAGAIGLGATSRLLTGGLAAAEVGIVAEELLTLPQVIGSKEGAALAGAMPYFNLRLQTAALGRAGGFSGRGLLGQLYQGPSPPAWMARLGLGPGDADRMLSDYGFVQPSVGASRRVVENLARMAFVPGLSGLPAGAMAQSAGEAASAGVVSGTPGGILAFTRQMAPILADAVAQGGNRIQILHTINETMARAAVGGYANPLTAAGIGRVIGQTMNAPGGRSGAAAMTLMQGAHRFLAGAGTQPLPTLGLATELPQNQAQMKALLDRGQPGAYEMMVGPAGAAQGYAGTMQDYFTALRSGDQNSATYYLGQLLNSQPGDRMAAVEHTADLIYPHGSPQWLRWVAVRMGTTPMVVHSMLAGQGGSPTVVSYGAGTGTLGARSNNPLNLSYAHQTGASGYTMTRNGRKEAVFRSTELGFMAAERQLLRDQGRGAHSVSQLLQAWTPGGKNNAAHAAMIAHALGVSPNAPVNLNNPHTMNAFVGLLSNIESPGALDAMPPGSLLNATANTFGLPGSVNMPTTTLPAIANAKAGVMFGHRVTAGELNSVIAGLNAALETAVKVALAFAQGMEKAEGQLGHAVLSNPSGMMASP